MEIMPPRQLKRWGAEKALQKIEKNKPVLVVLRRNIGLILIVGKQNHPLL